MHKILNSKLDLSPKSRSKRNGGEGDGDRVDVVTSGEIADCSMSVDGLGDLKGSADATANHIGNDLCIEQHQPQTIEHLNKYYRSESPTSNVNSNNNNNNTSPTVEEISENYRRPKYITESTSNTFSNRHSSYEDESSSHRHPQMHLQSPLGLHQGPPPSSNHNDTSTSSPLRPAHAENTERFFHNTSDSTSQVHIDERNGPTDLTSGRSSVGSLVIAEEDCSPSTSTAVFGSEDPTIRQSSPIYAPVTTPLLAGISSTSSTNAEKIPESLEKKVAYNDINMDRYGGSTPLTTSNVSRHHRYSPVLAPRYSSTRSYPYSRGSTNSSHASMQHTVSLPPRSMSPPPPLPLPPPPPLSHRASSSTIISPSHGAEAERGRSHSRPNSWAAPGGSR